mmetsp:Transcript_11803/g.26763  ORF Transcript_11803/g.26763 Transcript_11803/m.26763 type:complete len:762 (+) Transcript_11803:113-2398(+)
MDQFPRHHAHLDPAKISERVDEVYRSVGCILDERQECALLADTLCLDAPCVGVTAGFCQLTGYSRQEVLGRNCRMMLKGVPEAAISKSSRKNVRDFCRMCQLKGLKDISETTSMQPNCRQDGSFFMNLFLLGLCMLGGHPFILSVQVEMGQGLFVRLRQDELADGKEKARHIFKQIRGMLKAKCGEGPITRALSDGSPQRKARRPPFAFFSGRLQDHCLLINDGYTAIRREPEEVASSCLVFADRPVSKDAHGLSFRVRVDCATDKFVGFPILGFTQQRPRDDVSLYPVVSKCLGASVLLGACGEAFARDQVTNYNIGFKQPPQSEIQTWVMQADVPPQRRGPPVPLKSGDELQCIYTRKGRLQLLSNGTLVMDFETGRPMNDEADYYPIVDVCLAAYCVTILPSEGRPSDTDGGFEVDGISDFRREVSFATSVSFMSPDDSEQDEIETSYSSKMDIFDLSASADAVDTHVREAVVTQGIEDAIAQCTFCVTVADPRLPDCPLIAVSDEFERMTGFTRGEALGVNCRFLNEGCDMNPEELLNLRMSSQTGAPFTAIIPNRKKSGEKFFNLLDLRGLTIAKDPSSGEDIWYLIGIQADVSAVTNVDVESGHLAQMQQVSDTIRATVAQELGDFTLAGVNHMEKNVDGSYCVLKKPLWRPGSPLGKRVPKDLRARTLAAEALARQTSSVSSRGSKSPSARGGGSKSPAAKSPGARGPPVDQPFGSPVEVDRFGFSAARSRQLYIGALILATACVVLARKATRR